MSRDDVERSQLERLLQAAIELGTERGFSAPTVSDLVARAGVSRKTFYEHFTDKEACTIAAFDHAATEVMGRLGAAPGTDSSDVSTRVASYVTALLEIARERPELVLMFAIDAESVGRDAAAHHLAMRRRLADWLLTRLAGRREHELTPLTEVHTLAIVGATNEVIQQALHDPEPGALDRLQGPLTGIVLALLHPIDAPTAPPGRASRS